MTRPAPAAQRLTTPHQFAFAINEDVEVAIRGTIIERKNTEHGDQYWIEQKLPDGRTARQWFKERDVYEADAANDNGVRHG